MNIYQQNVEFSNYLVEAITKKSITGFSNSELVIAQEKSFKIFQNFIYNFFQEKFEPKDLIRIQNAASEPDAFEKFPDLEEKYNQAYKAFLEYLITI
jgi:hypothetical protein